MKNTKTCPKCQSTNIVRFDALPISQGGEYILTGPFSTVDVHKYICCACGYVEEWIGAGDLERVANSKKAIR